MTEILLLLAILVGLIVSLKDFRQGLIPNKHIALLLLLGIVFQFFSAPPLSQFLTVIAYGLIVSVLLWFIGIWPAGDAKFFFALLWFFPPTFYLSIVLIVNFLVNVFVPIFFFMLFVILFKSRLGVLRKAVKYSFEPYKVFMLVVIFLGFVWFVMKAIQLVVAIQVDYFLMLLLLFIAFEALYRTLSAKMEFFLVGCAMLRIALDYKQIYSLAFFMHFTLIILVFIFFRFFILYLAFELYTKKVPIGKLKAGMSPAEGIIRKGKNFEKVSFLQASLIGFMSQRKHKFLHDLNHFTKKDVKKIKKLRKEGKIPFATVLINQTQPFAPFILAGFLLTLLCTGDFVSWLNTL